MLIDAFDWPMSVRTLQLIFALGLGLAFGAAAQISRFCLRRAVAGEDGADGSAASVWIMALAVAVGGFAAASALGYVDVADHRYLTGTIPVAAIVIGGLMFGAGMVLTRGCVSRLTVLSATGNMRALVVLGIFAITAHAALKGVLAPLRTSLGAFTIDAPIASLSAIPGAAPLIALALLSTALYLARQSGTRARDLALGGVIGLVAVGGWATTSVLLMDEFDPLPLQPAAFTLPWTDTLFWTIAATAIPAGFGVGFVAGVLGGSFSSAALRGEISWQGFETSQQMLRYGAGGAMMGLGGVLAGGCTVGAGLSGGAVLGVSALLALGAIIIGAIGMRQILEPRGRLAIG